MKRGILYVLALLAVLHPVYGEPSRFEISMEFDLTAKLDRFSLNDEASHINEMSIEGLVNWTEFTQLYGRLKLDNWAGSVGTILFGNEIDERLGMHYPVVFDQFYIQTRILDEIGIANTIDWALLLGYNAAKPLIEEWTAFNFENYSLAEAAETVIATSFNPFKDAYFFLAWNPFTFTAENSELRGLTRTSITEPELLAGAAWRRENWWGQVYYDSYAVREAESGDPSLSVFGWSCFWKRSDFSWGDLRFYQYMDYGFSSDSAYPDHLRFGGAVGGTFSLLKGLETNFSYNVFLLDRREANMGWEGEFFPIKHFGVFAAFGCIKMLNTPNLVYEAGGGFRYKSLMLRIGYSDHQEGNEGWYSGAFDSSSSGRGLFVNFVWD